MTDRTCPACKVEHLGPLASTLDACAYCGAPWAPQGPPGAGLAAGAHAPERAARRSARDPGHIPGLLAALEGAWRAKPDLRLAQLVCNAARAAGHSAGDPFHCSDEALSHGLLGMLSASGEGAGATAKDLHEHILEHVGRFDPLGAETDRLVRDLGSRNVRIVAAYPLHPGQEKASPQREPHAERVLVLRLSNGYRVEVPVESMRVYRP